MYIKSQTANALTTILINVSIYTIFSRFAGPSGGGEIQRYIDADVITQNYKLYSGVCVYDGAFNFSYFFHASYPRGKVHVLINQN